MTCKSISGCKNDVYKELDNCALHCSEQDVDEKEFHDYLMSFYKLFSDHLHKEVEVEINRSRCKNKCELDERDKDIEEYHMFIGGIKPEGISASLTERIEKVAINFNEIQLPNDINMRYLDSESHMLLRMLGKVMFIKCYFYSKNFSLYSNFYYKDCKFVDNFIVNPFPKIENDESYRYVNCTFEKNVSIEPSDYSKEVFCNLFEDCNFKEDVKVINLIFKKNLIKLPDPLIAMKSQSTITPNLIYKPDINKIKELYDFKKIVIRDCKFDSSLKLNGWDEDYIIELKSYKFYSRIEGLIIDSLVILDTKFKSKLEIKNSIIQNFEFKNSNVEGIFDTYESSLIKAKFYKSIFGDFAAFEYVVFGDCKRENITEFIYTTFKDFSNFRNTEFKSGLNFSSVNIKQEPNFLDTKVSKEGTDRETFRIIKNSFEKSNNKIEAGKYHAYEMNAYMNELSFCKNFWQLSILHMNNLISKFGQSYIRPLLLLIGCIALYSYLLDFYQEVLQFRVHKIQYGLEAFTEKLNTGARNFSPFARFISNKRGFEFVSLFFYIVFAILIWQTIVAVKKQTQH